MEWSDLTPFERKLINEELRWLDNIVLVVTLFSAFTAAMTYPF